jgi:sulfite reductase (NADPH) flavoprotein alpha-component
MLAPSKLKLLQDLVDSASREELVWVNGYLSGLLAKEESSQEAAAPAATAKKVTIVYGTETGNTKKLATDFAARAKKNGIAAKVVSLDQYRVSDLSKEEYFLTLVSTHGDGEPPAAARKFYDHIHKNGFKLPQLKYGVLALGDTAYPLFCKTGEDIDSQLKKLGGEPIVSLRKCDTDYRTDAEEWFAQVLQRLGSEGKEASAASPVVVKKTTSKKRLSGTVLTNINLNDRGSNKETRHIEITAEDLDYQPGDAIGIMPENPLAVVEAILERTGIERGRSFVLRNEPHTVFDLLKKKLNVSVLPNRVVKQYAEIVEREIPDSKTSLLQLLQAHPLANKEQFEKVIGILEPITPRLYSIASSLQAHEGEVHLTVARDTYCIDNTVCYGLCSDYLAGFGENDTLEFYVHPNNQFRLPQPDRDIILIGPGTGIAPFRAFLEERDAVGATGRNWLFFGEQHFQTDFLYQSEIQNWVQTGVLTRVNVAFSRDQAQKVYVQHKMQAQAGELFRWLEGGAYVYVCGTKSPMSEDVEATLLQIIQEQGHHSKKQAAEYLERLKEEGRYLKDVY